jgi:hypothetical protein
MAIAISVRQVYPREPSRVEWAIFLASERAPIPLIWDTEIEVIVVTDLALVLVGLCA